MTTERDSGTRIVLSWLREDAHENAERVLLRTLDEVDTTHQRRSGWPAWRTFVMNPALKFGLAAAAVLVVAVVGYNLLPRTGPNIGTATPAPTSTAVPTAVPATPLPSGPRPLTEGPLAAGTYYANPFPAPLAALRIEYTVPDGWRGAPPNAVIPAVGTAGPGGAAVAALRPASLFADPCHDHALESQTIDAGETVDELVAAIAEITSGDAPPYMATRPRATVISGFAGQRLDLFLPSATDFAECEEGTFWVWAAGPYAQGPANRWHLWILDVDGTRVVVLGQDFATTATEVQDDLEAIVNSIRIEP